LFLRHLMLMQKRPKRRQLWVFSPGDAINNLNRFFFLIPPPFLSYSFFQVIHPDPPSPTVASQRYPLPVLHDPGFLSAGNHPFFQSHPSPLLFRVFPSLEKKVFRRGTSFSTPLPVFFLARPGSRLPHFELVTPHLRQPHFLTLLRTLFPFCKVS